MIVLSSSAFMSFFYTLPSVFGMNVSADAAAVIAVVVIISIVVIICIVVVVPSVEVGVS